MTMFGKIEQSFKANGKKLDSFISIVDNLNNAVKSEMQGTFGKAMAIDDGETYAVTMSLIANADMPITDSFVTAYARLWVDMWKKSNSISYNAVVARWTEKGIDASDANIAEQMKNVLYRGVIGNEVNAEIASDKLFGRNANNFKAFLNRLVNAIAAIKNKLWGEMGRDFQIQAEAFASGDWSVVLNTQTTETKAVEKTDTPITHENDVQAVETPTQESTSAEVETADVGETGEQNLGEVGNAEETDTVEAVELTNATKKDIIKLTGNKGTAYTNDNTPVEFRYVIISADDLIASNNSDGSVNSEYPKELQPRDRTRVTSFSQIKKMANNIVPERLSENIGVSDGAPIIGSDNVVESGNGRVLALRQMFSNGKSEKYIDFLNENASKFGISGDLPNNPVLVRERITEVDRAEFAKQANESSLSSMSATEKSKADAERLTPAILNLLTANDEGQINTTDNKIFIGMVVNKVFPENERNSVVTPSGMLSANGLERITNAIFFKAYNDMNLASRLAESLDDDMKNITKVLLNVAPKVVSIKNGISEGDNYDFDFSTDIVRATQLFSELKANGYKIDDYLNQISLDDYTDLEKIIASVFEQKNRGAKQATEIINTLLDGVMELGSPNQASFLGANTNISKEGLLYGAITKYNKQQTEEKRTYAIPEYFKSRANADTKTDRVQQSNAGTEGKTKAADSKAERDSRKTKGEAEQLASEKPAQAEQKTADESGASVSYSVGEEASDFAKAFTVDKDGTVTLISPQNITIEQWGLISKAFDRLGYDIGSAETAKTLYTRTIPRMFNNEQSKVLRKMLGLESADVSAASTTTALERAKKAAKTFGATSDFREAGYLTIEGKLLDFSEKKDGGPPHQRSADHRYIAEVFEEEQGTDAMMAFINEGNIRLLPESGGIDLSVKPNTRQKNALRAYFDYFNGEVIVDFSAESGHVIKTLEYPKRTASARILSDIEAFFNDGEVPTISRLGDFLYSVGDKSAPNKSADLETMQAILANSPNAGAVKIVLEDGIGERAKGEYSYNEGYGTHKGDLGKADSFGTQYTSSRSTGHFGTGTYFVGENLEGDFEKFGKDRPIHKVDFSKYNLYTPMNYNDGMGLHNALKSINSIRPDSFEGKVRFNGTAYTEKFFVEDILPTQIKYSRDKTPLSNSDIAAAYYATKGYVSEIAKLPHTVWYASDSASTFFMKQLGYDGVDVRHIRKLDNTEYGSVIYDLKGSDIRYSLQAAQTINGYYDKKAGEIHINLQSVKSPLTIFGHELFHSLPVADQMKLVAFFREAANTNTAEFKAYKTARMAAYQKLYDEKGLGEFAERDFWNEFTAENCETLFTNKAYVDSLAQKSKSLAQKILDFIRALWRKLTGTTYENSRATEVSGITVVQLAQAEKLYAAALKVKSEVSATGEGMAASVTDNVRYSIEQNNLELSKLYESTQKSPMLTDETKKQIEGIKDSFYYKRVANDETMIQALAEINSNYEKAFNAFLRVTPDKASTIDIAKGFVLLDHYQREKMYNNVIEVSQKLREIGTSKGQAVQIYSILGRFTPMGMLKYAQSEIDKIVKVLAEEKGRKWVEANRHKYDLTAEEAQQIIETMTRIESMPDGRDKAVAIAEIMKLLQSRIPAKASDKLRAFQRVSMLFNPKTVISRNALSNLLINPIYAINDFWGAGIDKAIGAKTGVRTTGFADYRSQLKGAKRGAFESYDDFRRKINTRGILNDKYERMDVDAFGNGLFTKRTTKEGTLNTVDKKTARALAWLDRATSFLLDVGDRPFFEGYFLESINNQLALNGRQTPTPSMIELATNVALEKTWQDDNSITMGAKRIRDGLNFGKRFGLGNLIFPFSKTPANLTKAIVQFSPVNLVKGLTFDAVRLNKAIKNGTATAEMQRKFVDNMGKAITGTLIFMLGAVLYNMGRLAGKDDEKDKDIRDFKRNVMGLNQYSIRMFGNSFTVDWLQPVGGILFGGAAAAEGSKIGETFLDSMIQIASVSGNTLFDRSFMQGIQGLLSYDEPMEALTKTLLSAPQQMLSPTLINQMAQLIDDNQRIVYTKEGNIQDTINSFVNRTPFASKTLEPRIDVLGRDVKKYGGNDNVLKYFFNVFLNPANPTYKKSEAFGDEVYRVYEATGAKDIFPRIAPNNFNNGGTKYELKGKDYTEFQRSLGQKSANGLKQLAESADYQNATDDKKAEMLKKVVDGALAQTKKEYVQSKGYTWKK